MKKSILLLTVLSFIVLLFSCTNKTESDLQKAELKGKIKAIREISYEAFGTADTLVKGNIIDNQGAENSYTLYNEQGNIVSLIKYDKDNAVKYKWRFYYDKKGKRQISAKRYEAKDFEEDSTSYVYDKKGNPIEYIHYSSDGKIKTRSVSKFNKKGNMIEEKVFDEKNLLKKSSKFRYKKTKLVEGKSFDSEGKLLIRSIYSYDKKGNMLSMTMVDGENNPISKGTYTYNKDGFVQTELLKRPGYTDLLLEYIYVVDVHGNWTQRIMLSENEAFQITRRQIEYYE